MFRHVFGLSVALFALGAAVPVSAGSAFGLTFQNDTKVAMTVIADGHAQCKMIAPGKSCRVVVENPDAAFAYIIGDGEKTAFTPGNLEAVDLCKADDSGMHCIDPNATAAATPAPAPTPPPAPPPATN